MIRYSSRAHTSSAELPGSAPPSAPWPTSLTWLQQLQHSCSCTCATQVRPHKKDSREQQPAKQDHCLLNNTMLLGNVQFTAGVTHVQHTMLFVAAEMSGRITNNAASKLLQAMGYSSSLSQRIHFDDNNMTTPQLRSISALQPVTRNLEPPGTTLSGTTLSLPNIYSSHLSHPKHNCTC